ncbi:hypothetical protein NPIL_395291, partial [Nephila pilipes]
TFEGFDSRVLEFKPVMHMSGSRGRVRQLSALVVVGNKKGLAGKCFYIFVISYSMFIMLSLVLIDGLLAIFPKYD